MLNWKVTSKGNGETHVLMYGDMNEAASFGELKLLRGRVVFDFAGIRRINSFGVRELLHFLEDLRKSATLEVERCSPALVTQLNMLPELCRQVVVRSLLAPMECPNCLQEAEVKIDILPSGQTVHPEARCDDCHTSMVFSEPEERYFAFLRESA